MTPIDVDFPRFYPANGVADHEVFMSFNGDEQAIAFREWWDTYGKQHFAAWFNEQGTASK